MPPKLNQWLTTKSQTDSAFDLSRLDEPSRRHDLAKISVIKSIPEMGVAVGELEPRGQVETGSRRQSSSLREWKAAVANDGFYEEYRIAQLPVHMRID